MTPDQALSLMDAEGVPRVSPSCSDDAAWEIAQSVAAWLDARGVQELVVYVTREVEGDAEHVRVKLIESEQNWCVRDFQI